MYLSNGGLDVDYLLEEDLGEDEFVEAEEKLIDRAYRDITEWRKAVRSEKDVEEVNSLAEEAARIAYLIDRVQTEYLRENSIGDLSENERKAVTEGNRAWRFVNDSGTRLEYEGKQPEEIREGAFVLLNGDNIGFDKPEHDRRDLYTPPGEFIEEMSGPFRIDYVNVDGDADLQDLPERYDWVEF